MFGVLVAIAGCLRGMQCGRSSAAVGQAATSAVVTGIVFIIVSDAILTVDLQCPRHLAASARAPRRCRLASRCSDLTMAYGSFVIQRDLDFTVGRGEIFVIMGGSGCGKSTLLAAHDRAAWRPPRGDVL